MLATIGLYANDLSLGFFGVDDPDYVVNNRWIRSVSGENLGHILGTPYFANYSPLHLLSYMLDYTLAGANAFAFHLSSNIWAGLAAGFVFLVALALTGRRAIALAAAALFTVHPAHVEAIAWISSRKDLVAVVFALPSLLAYLRYRQGGPDEYRWYVASLLLFILAVAGKLSVATFPAVFVAYDILVKKRPLVRSFADKIPFLAAAGCIAMVVGSAQPPTGHTPDTYVVSAALLQNIWLLTGFGNYVIYRLPPDPAMNVGFKLGASFLVLGAIAVPLLFRRRAPMAAVLALWILFAFIPSQVLSFTHPVADRYLFFPSVAAVILIASGVIASGERLGRWGLPVGWVMLLVLALIWGQATLKYLGEWRDPRSVWYASSRESADPDAYYGLGDFYVKAAERLGVTPRGAPLPDAEARPLASAIWAGDPRLPGLLEEWVGGKRGGPVEKEFQDQLRTLAWDALEEALDAKGPRVMPDLYYSRGLILVDRNENERARKEFLAALDEVSRFTVFEARGEVTVNSHNALGAIDWKKGDYREALRWYRLAEEEQARFGGNWVPDVAARRNRVEGIVAMLPGASAKSRGSDDPDAGYNLGLHYLDAADRLGLTPRDEAQRLATEVWSTDVRLPTLLSEWAGGTRGGPVEKTFAEYLRTLAWDALERALRVKGTRVMPHLYFRRGMILGQRGDLQGAQKEFLAALGEASRDSSAEVRQEVTVVSHDALGTISWKAGDYREALRWYRLAEEEQIRSGRRWVVDLTAKRQTLEGIVAKSHGP